MLLSEYGPVWPTDALGWEDMPRARRVLLNLRILGEQNAARDRNTERHKQQKAAQSAGNAIKSKREAAAADMAAKKRALAAGIPLSKV